MSADASTLARELAASRERLQRITADLGDDQLLGPKLAIVNPPLWELGHLAWFQEFWCLRHRGDRPPLDSILPGADALYDSAKVVHAARWNLPLPTIEGTRAYLADVLGLVQGRLESESENARLHYFADLAAFHEDMHAEAFHYSRQTLGLSNPFGDDASQPDAAPPAAKDIALEGGTFLLGASPGTGFVFDNEKWAHEVLVAPFGIASTAVSNAQYAQFVEAGGYARRDYWSEEGWAWLAASAMKSPRYWVKEGNGWRLRRFDRAIALPGGHPVMHVNWHEANAYCRFARRRLPTEAEWEFAASVDAAGSKRRFPWGDTAPQPHEANLQQGGTAPVDAYAAGDSQSGCGQLIGNVWEWTASTFDPYPCYEIDPYKEYSEPWFGTHKVLRGGSFATARRLVRNSWRNFYTPDRGDIFAGFRTARLQ